MPYKDPQKKKEHDQLYFQNHRENFREYRRCFYRRHREKQLKEAKEYRQNHRKEAVLWATNWQKRNPEKYKEIVKKVYQKRKESGKINAYARLWREKNKEKIRKYRLEYEKKYRNKNREKIRFKLKIRQDRVRGAIGKHTLIEWENLKMQHNWTCPHCKMKEPEIKLTRDHIIPITKNGTNDIKNIQPLCQSCNSKKHTKIIYLKGR